MTLRVWLDAKTGAMRMVADGPGQPDVRESLTPYRVVATLWCGHCTGEHRGRRSRLGEVRRHQSGHDRYVSHDPERRMWSGRGDDMAPIYSTQRPYVRQGSRWRVGVWLDGPGVAEVPTVLPVFCRGHGHGGVATSTVVAARGTVTVTYISDAGA